MDGKSVAGAESAKPRCGFANSLSPFAPRKHARLAKARPFAERKATMRSERRLQAKGDCVCRRSMSGVAEGHLAVIAAVDDAVAVVIEEPQIIGVAEVRAVRVCRGNHLRRIDDAVAVEIAEQR